MPRVRVLTGTLAYGTATDRKVAQKGDVIELSEEQLSKLTVAPAYPATVELVQEDREERKSIARKEKEKPAESPQSPK